MMEEPAFREPFFGPDLGRNSDHVFTDPPILMPI